MRNTEEWVDDLDQLRRVRKLKKVTGGPGPLDVGLCRIHSNRKYYYYAYWDSTLRFAF